ncbi:MAG: archease [Candidatus Thorarchaeota archaeon]
MSFRYLDDLTSDVAFEVQSQSLSELLETSARAMLNIMYDLDEITPVKSIVASTTGEDTEHLLHRWLTEILFLFEVENMFFCEFRNLRIRESSEGLTVEGELWGDDADSALMQTHVKGVTYHKFSVRQNKDEWIATVVVDI